MYLPEPVGYFDSLLPDTMSVISRYGSPIYFIGGEQYTMETTLPNGETCKTTANRGGVTSDDVGRLLKDWPDRRIFERPLSRAEVQQLSLDVAKVLENVADETPLNDIQS